MGRESMQNAGKNEQESIRIEQKYREKRTGEW